MHWYFACMYVYRRVLDTLELEIQLWELNQGPLEKQPVLVTSELSLHISVTFPPP